jgi:hypothetical protein
MDKLSFHFDESVFKNFAWLDPNKSWKNKWKNGDPKQGERFWLSSTLLVATTDLWHFAKLVMISCLVGAAAVPLTAPLFNSAWGIVGLFVGLKILYSGVFHIFFTYVLKSS